MRDHIRLSLSLGLLFSVVLLLAAACSDSDSNDNAPTEAEQTSSVVRTVEPGATAADPPDGTEQPGADETPTEDPIADQTSRTVRDVERSVQRLGTMYRILVSRAGRSSSGLPGTPEDDEGRDEGQWFDECCDDAIGDFAEEFQEIRRELPDLIAVYEDASDADSLALVDEIASSVANVEASLLVLASLPTNESAPAILEDMLAELLLLTEATSNLR